MPSEGHEYNCHHLIGRNMRHVCPAGVQFLSPTAVLTTSVDQRLNVWEIANMSLVLVWGTVHDVADTAAMKVLRTVQR